MTESGKEKTPRDLASHRRARHDYTILETLEAGIELRGTEVKSIRAGEASLAESFAAIEKNEAIVQGLHIQPYRFGNQFNHDPKRPKRLLLHRREIDRLRGLTATQGVTLIPLRLFLRKGLVKLELGICKGKQQADKRETLRQKTSEREAEREIVDRRR
ncbi:MAG: SsrA-binding protein SmpB [Kiritimatiellia bacterium]|nr:SsrA-binding protein SmpB [Kiritimatiellia bacterium]